MYDLHIIKWVIPEKNLHSHNRWHAGNSHGRGVKDSGNPGGRRGRGSAKKSCYLLGEEDDNFFSAII